MPEIITSFVQRSFTTPNVDVTQDMINALEGISQDGQAVFIFGEGEFFISGFVPINCNVRIIGSGCKSSKITILEGDIFDQYDDYFIGCFGTPSTRINVEISNIEISTQDHSTMWWNGVEKHLIKITFANHVKIHNIISRCSNAVCTNIDMRVCSNISVTGCELVNYNNSQAGGILWMRHDTRNVQITNNRIVKYGNDEMIAFWLPSQNYDQNQLTPAPGVKENILIADNDIVYEKPEWATDIIAGVQISLFNDYNPNNPDVDVVKIKFSNFSFVNNRIIINAPITNLIGITFGANDTHDRIVISNNSVTCTDRSSAQNSHFTMFSITDKSGCKAPVIVEDNVISSAATTIDQNGYNSRTLLQLTNSSIIASGNIYSGIYQKVGDKSIGMSIVRPYGGGCKLVLNSNKFRGINKIGSFTNDSLASDLNVALVARDNIFSGDTRIYCKNLTHGYLTFENNVFISDCYEMLLQEFASGGNLIFNNNQVAILFSNNGSYQGRLFVHYSGGLPANAHFDMFEVTGNIVRGTSESIWLGMPSQGDCGTYNVSGNTFYSLPWQTSLF